MATGGEIRWPPTGSFPWPPSPQNGPHQMLLRQPIRQRRRHQQQLTTITPTEFSSHPGSVLTRIVHEAVAAPMVGAAGLSA